MKKIFSLLFSGLAITAAHAQQSTQSVIFNDNPARIAQDRRAIDNIPASHVFDRVNNRKAGGTQRTTSSTAGRWYSYPDMLSNFFTVSYSAPYLWNDTTSKDAYSAATGGTEYDYNTLINVGLICDPYDARWSDPINYAGLIQLTQTNAYTIDSVFFSGIYMRNNAHTTPVDTLTIGVTYGDGTTPSDVHNYGIDTTGGRTWIPQEYGTDSLYYSRIKFDSVNNHVDTFMGGYTPLVKKIYLHNTDTSSVFNMAVPVSINVPAGGNVPVMSLSFKSGDPAFTPGDSVFQSSGVGATYKYGMFRPLVAFQGSSSAPEFPVNSSGDRSEGQFLSVSTYGTYRYTPHWFFYNSSTNGASTYQYPAFAFHISCSTCSVLDAASVQKMPVTTNVYPDPANGELNISYHLPAAAQVSVKLMNLMGQVAATAANGSAADGKVVFNTAALPAGVYIYQLSAGAEQTSGRVVIAH